MRFRVRKRRNFFSVSWLIAIIFFLGIFIFWEIETNLKPTLMAIAETKATVIATQSINNVIHNKISSMIEPKSLVNVTLDGKGKVALIQPNTMEFNRLASDTTIKVQDALKEIPNQQISIPMGQIFGSQLLATWGPPIVVSVVPMGTVEVKVEDKFEQAGINQTRHMVSLLVTAQIRIVVPLVSKVTSVNTKVPIAEYIIIGEVPNTYVQFPFPLGQNDASLKPPQL